MVVDRLYLNWNVGKDKKYINKIFYLVIILDIRLYDYMVLFLFYFLDKIVCNDG